MLNNYKKVIKNISFITLLLFLQNSLISQELYQHKKIDSVFDNYTKPFQEVIYTHINKSKFIKGETLGFTSYAFNEQKKQLTTLTSNLYCIITDVNNKVVKKKLIKVENGIANGSFNIDSKFKSGTYTFKAYTNWMLNFSKNNYFVDTFNVIDPETTKFAQKTLKNTKIDVQILPESGHLLNNVINTMGVVVKDNKGYGVADLEGNIYDSNNNQITSFTLNPLGIGRFSFIPKKDKSYYAVLNYEGKEKKINLTEEIKLSGVILKITENKNNALISVVTNKNTLPKIKEKKYKLTFHNGNILNTININFNNKLNIVNKVPLKKLSRGVNIFTLFDEKNRPIAERMFFNYSKLNVIKSKGLTKRIINDSIISTTLNFEDAKRSGFNNLSVSILPKGTKSYQKNSNIISQVLVQPYIKGVIENGGYYFTNINKEKKYQLDNLLLTQGWSSFNWEEIFNYENNHPYLFEKGISLKANIPNSKKTNTFYIHNLTNRTPEVINFNKKFNSFSSDNYFPLDNESLYISMVDKKGKLKPLGSYLQFYPNEIPVSTSIIERLNPKQDFYASENLSEVYDFQSLNKKEMLDEVVIKTNLEKKRMEKIKNKSHGDVYFIKKNYSHFTLARFLNGRSGLYARDNHIESLFEVNTGASTPRIGLKNLGRDRNATPVVFIDGNLIIDKQRLFNYKLDYVDFIEINPTEQITGITRGIGSIRIVTDPTKLDINAPSVSKFKFPITFAKAKRFYVPKYQNYNNSFYKNYGVIDWLPINQINRNGNLNIEFINKQPNDVKLFIEGVTEDGDYIFEEKTITVKPNKNI